MGDPLDANALRKRSSFVGWDFTDTGPWTTQQGNFRSYPYLRAITYDAPGTLDSSRPIPGLQESTTPLAPGSVIAKEGNAKVRVSWVVPDDDGGSPITGYTVIASPDGATCVTTGGTTCTVTGLTNGTTYTFTVVATNEIGDGPASEASAAVIPSNLLFFDRFELLDAIR